MVLRFPFFFTFEKTQRLGRKIAHPRMKNLHSLNSFRIYYSFGRFRCSCCYLCRWWWSKMNINSIFTPHIYPTWVLQSLELIFREKSSSEIKFLIILFSESVFGFAFEKKTISIIFDWQKISCIHSYLFISILLFCYSSLIETVN